MSNDIGGMEIPPNEALDQFLHQPGRGHPGSIDGLLIVNDVGGWIELYGSPFAHESNFSPFASGSNRCNTRCWVGRTVERAFHAGPPGQVLDLRDVIWASRSHDVR